MATVNCHYCDEQHFRRKRNFSPQSLIKNANPVLLTRTFVFFFQSDINIDGLSGIAKNSQFLKNIGITSLKVQVDRHNAFFPKKINKSGMVYAIIIFRQNMHGCLLHQHYKPEQVSSCLSFLVNVGFYEPV